MSVIVPVRNREDRIAEALTSVLDQSYSELEVVVVDDASEDETAAVVAGLGSQRVRLVRLRKRGGAAAARNHGIAESRGELVAFQDSDDLWLPGKLELQVSVLTSASPQVGAVYGPFRLVGRKTTVVPSRLVRWNRWRPGCRLAGDLSRTLVRGNPITTQAALARRTCLADVGGFDARLERFDDWDLWLRIAARYRFAYVNEILVEVRQSAGSLSTDTDAALRDLAHMAARHPAAARSLEAVSCRILGETMLDNGDAAMARRHFARAVRLAPSDGSHWLGLVAALMGRRAAGVLADWSGLGYRRDGDHPRSAGGAPQRRAR